MSQIPIEIVLVVPVWNDSQRLEKFAPELLSAIRESGLPIIVVVADDGSSPGESARIAAIVRKIKANYSRVELCRVEQRTRKGGAIYHAWNQFPNADWLGFVDADGAVSGSSIIALIGAAMELGKQGGAIAIRPSANPDAPRRHFSRSVAFHVFRFMVRRLLGIQFMDTQCGAKVIPGGIYRAVANRLDERGFIFDVELLLALESAGCRIVEIPTPWDEKPFGKIRPYRDAWAMLAAIWRIRRRLKAGHYSKGH